MKELKTREALLKAVAYVAAILLVVSIGYNIFLLVSHKVNSPSELAGIPLFSMVSFGFALLISNYGLKKVKAELTEQEKREL